MPTLSVLALAKPQTAATCTSVPNCYQKCAKSVSAGTVKTSNSSNMHISAKLLPKVCQVCQFWHWQNLKQQRHAHHCQIAAKSVPSLPVLALPNFMAVTCSSVLALIWCCQAHWVGLSGSCYMGHFLLIFIFRVPESCSSDNILVRPLRWDVRTVEFMKISLKLSLPAHFP